MDESTFKEVCAHIERAKRYEAALREILRHCEDPNIPAVDVWSAVWDFAREALKEPAR